MVHDIAVEKSTNKSKTAVLKLLLFFLWPFGSFLYALLYRPNSKSSYCVYFLWGLLFCWSIYYSPWDSFYIDFVTIVEKFYDTQLTFSELCDRIIGILTLSSYTDGADFYNIVVYWLSHQFSSNFHFMYVIAGIPFLYCMLYSLRFITQDQYFKANIYGYILLFLFVLPCSIFAIQNFRFSTGFWCCVFLILKVFYEQKKKYIPLFIVLPFIHYSFWLVIVVFLVFSFLKGHNKLIKWILICSIPFAVIPINAILDSFTNSNLLPILLTEKGDAYLSDEATANWGMYANGMRSYFKVIQSIIAVVATYIMLMYIEKQEVDKRLCNLLKLLCILLFTVNFINVVPVIGERFYLLCRTLCIFLWFKICPQKKYFIWIFLAGAALDIYEISMLYMKVLTPDFFYSNLFWLVVKNIGITHYY